MKLTFVGATTTVTGSKTILEYDNQRILIDCGLYQENSSNESAENINQSDLDILNTHFDAVILTHAHLDHSGLLPFLFKKGFRGPIFSTKETAKLTRIILEDSAELIKNQIKNNNATLYSPEDAQNVISLFKPQDYKINVNFGNMTFSFHRAAHILGAAFVRIEIADKIITFSGDLGRFDDLFLGQPDQLPMTNYLILESTYGATERETTDHLNEVKKLIEKAINQNATLLISSFALHRAQYLTYLIKKIFYLYPELKIPFFLNSPMMEQVFFTYLKFKDEFSHPSFKEFSLKEAFEELNFLDSFWEIETRNDYQGAQIIIASSGMLTGGRIWTHLKKIAPVEKNILFLPGYQAINTPGYQLINGEKKLLNTERELIEFNCEIIHSSNFSSHAAYGDLQKWLNLEQNKQITIFLNHGEEQSKIKLQKKLEENNIKVICPKKKETFNL